MTAFAFHQRVLIGLSLLVVQGLAEATYTKVSNTGKALPDSAVLGTGPNDWACTYDSNTKLVWEVKTSDGGLRDQGWIYSWYDSKSQNGNPGYEGVGVCQTSGRCDTEKFTQEVNAHGLCGAKDWRLPSNEELKTLVYCSSGTYNILSSRAFGYICPADGTDQQPTINLSYFPNTTIAAPNYGWFWTATVSTGDPYKVWGISFEYGYDDKYDKSYAIGVRLVRADSAFASVSGMANIPPTADFSSSAESGTAPLSLNLDATAASDTDGSIASYVWSSSDGSSIVNGKTTRVTFTQPGVYSLTLTVTDDKGATGKTSKTITVTSATTTTVPATTDTGYIEGNILNACNQKPLKSVNLQFASGSFNRLHQSDRDGHYVLELGSGVYNVTATYTGYKADSRTLDLAAGEIRIGNFNLTPTAGCGNVQPANSKRALLIAGSGPKLPSGDNHIWEYTQALTDRAYTALRLQGYKREDIRYLSADAQARDADADGSNDIDGVATSENLQQALTQWAGGVEQVVVYFIGHGGVNTLQLNRDTQLKPAQLKTWLDTLQSKLLKDQRGQPGKLTVIIDACKSGSFVAPLAASNRFIIASTQPDLDAIVSNQEGANSFSYHFWGQIGFKDGWLSTAFQQARQAMSSELVDRGKTQKAMLDADGSGDDTTDADYTAIGNYCYGNCTPHASVPVVIESVSPLDNLNGSFSRVLKVRASKDIAKAWVSIQRPDYHFPTDGTAITAMLLVNLNCQGGNTCEATYNNFNLNDNYQVTFYVQDKDNNSAMPYTATLFQSGIAASNAKKAASAVYEPSTGILTLKDVQVGAQHYYVEMHDQGGYRFKLQHFFALMEGANPEPASFDGSKLIIPNVYAEGGYYAVQMLMNGAEFVVANTKALP